MKKHISIIYYFLIIIGIAGVIVTLGYDYFRKSEPYFGKNQFMGFVGSIMILLVGLRKLSNSNKDLLDFVSLFIYISGMLYLVLIPGRYSSDNHPEMLQLIGLFTYDFVLNVVGFMPLGYLLMHIFAKFANKYSPTIRFLLISLIGILLSFLIEIVQYFIPGRTSSLIDVVANGSGNLFGMLLFLLDRFYTRRSS